MATESISYLTVVEHSAPPAASFSIQYSYNDAIIDAFGPLEDKWGQPELWSNSTSAIAPPMRDHTVFLWEQGCDESIYPGNCSITCSNETHHSFWQSELSMFTLHNCLLYPILATASAHDWLVEDPPGLLEKYGIIPNRTLPVTSPETYNEYVYQSAWLGINKCTNAVCDSLDKENARSDWIPCTSGHPMYATGYTVGPNDSLWTPFIDVSPTFCFWGNPILNADIGGPGVLASYIQQFAFVILAWIFVTYNTVWTKVVSKLYCYCRQYDRTSAAAVSRRLSDRLTFPKQNAIVLSVLQDFQRTQVFFVLTLQVVCVIVLYNPTMLGASNLLQMLLGRNLLQYIGAAGVYPVVLNAKTLHRDGKPVSWFLLTATWVCFATSFAMWVAAWRSKVAPENLIEDGPDQCGSKNPMIYCFDVFASDLNPNLPDNVILHPQSVIVPLIVMARIMADRLKIWTHWSGLAGKPIWLSAMSTLFTMFIEIWLLYANVVLMIRFGELVFANDTAGSGGNWTLGQIIAVAVWLPGIIEWLHLTARGIEEGFSTRLASGYHVTKRDAHAQDLDDVIGQSAINQGRDSSQTRLTSNVETSGRSSLV